MIDERYIVRNTNLSGGTYSIDTEYFLNDVWTVVHTEWCGDVSFLKECKLVDSKNDGYNVESIYEPKRQVQNDGIWIKNNEQKKGLPHFINVKDSNLTKLEPIYENTAETRFFIGDEFGEIIGCPELTESLNRMNDDMMYFNLNWIPEELNPTPLKKVLQLMNKKIEAEIIFHDVEGVVMYKIKLIGFRFEQIYNLRNYDWNDNGIKELAVQYNFDEEQIIVN